MMYYAAFDVSDLALGSLTLTTAGKDPAVVSLTALAALTPLGGSDTSSIFFHRGAADVLGQDPGSTPRLLDYAGISFAAVLENAIQEALTSESWTNPSDFTVACDPATGLYTLSYDGVFETEFGYAMNAAAAALLGFTTATSVAPQLSFVSDAVPTYAIHPSLPSTSLSTPNFEPTGIAVRVHSDSGDSFGASREVSPLHRDWVQQYETKAKTLRTAAVAAHPWTFQHLFEHCRTGYAFLVLGGFGDALVEVFSLRTEGMLWKPERASPGNDAQFHIPFRATVEGTVVDES